jgi:DNA polymerase-1
MPFIEEKNLKTFVKPLLQIHDEVIYEIQEDKVEKVIPEIKKIMETVIDTKDTNGVPLLVNYAIGKNWGELK